jgi:hypothetical protein
VGHVGGDADEVAGLGLHHVLEPVARGHLHAALEDEDRGLMGRVPVGLRAAAGRNVRHVHADALRAGRLAGDALGVGKALAAVVGGTGAELPAVGPGRLSGQVAAW